MSRTLTVGLVQHRCGEDREANLQKSIEAIREAADRGARLVLLQELHTSDAKRGRRSLAAPGS